ncbi:MAG: hypothetical protein ACK5IQ_00120 [Bacteroidales bacterium]
MDDILYYLVIIGAVVYQLYKAFKKKEKKVFGETSDSDGGFDEIKNLWEELKKEHEPPPPPQTTMPELNFVANSKLDAVPSEEGISFVAQEEKALRILRTKKTAVRKMHPLMKNFSLEKAVVYGEIIKPKYF